MADRVDRATTEAIRRTMQLIHEGLKALAESCDVHPNATEEPTGWRSDLAPAKPTRLVEKGAIVAALHRQLLGDCRPFAEA